jgi:4-amino-4-deoxy-L-arabinose transferase-like glycosyltransferase
MKNPLFKFLSRNYGKIIIVLILIIAAFYRLYRIKDYMVFLGDEGRDALVAYQILHGNLTLLGPTASVGGFFLGPIYYYFMAPFLWLYNYDPVGPAIMVALFGIATVWFIYKIGKEFFGTEVGLIAAGLYAISPLVVTYSRSSWNPNLMPFFSLLALYLTYKALEKKTLNYWFYWDLFLVF